MWIDGFRTKDEIPKKRGSEKSKQNCLVNMLQGKTRKYSDSNTDCQETNQE